jgi:diguanylate cyclase (GGDEF)-like protein
LISPTGDTLASPVDECLRTGMALRLSGQSTHLMTRDGRRMALDLRAASVPMSDGSRGVVLVFEDASQRLLLSEELAWRAAHDPVTGLLNRDEFELRVRAALSKARQGGEPSVLAMIDIDHFRLVNDVLGHAAGDELLHELAGELRVRLREGDVLARLSGDEFGVLLPGYRLEDADLVVQGLLEAARRYRFQWMDRNHPITISIGVAQLDGHTENVGRVLSLADAACHTAKQAGRDRARFMGIDDEALDHHSEMGVVGQVGRAIEEGRMFLISEDVVCVSDPTKVVYRELLVRMRGEDGSLIKPAHFVPAAERYYLMSALDRWVARHAFARIGASKLAASNGIIHAINVSGQSLSDPDFLPFILGEMASSGVNPAHICFEITETTAISRLTDASRFIGELTARGCKFALDDFGVGMSSFGYLKNFPVHFLKIDGSFVRSMRDSQIDHGMVEAINRIGHQLGLKTIAEHVESLDLLEPLRLMGVDWAQGHGISPGKPLDDIL